MGKAIDLNTLIGKKINKLTILSAIRKKKNNDKRNNLYVTVQCECGNIKEIKYASIKAQTTISCGCVHLQTLRNNGYIQKHGQSGNNQTKLYRIWKGLKSRCYTKTNPNYKYYGGRGIKVCDEWLSDYMNFYNWSITNDYQNDLSLDRIDNDGNYEPNNCRWTTAKEQANNKRNNRYITIDDETKTLTQWCEQYDINYTTVRTRLDDFHWNIIDALTKPVHKSIQSGNDNQRLYRIWKHMKNRCCNNNCLAFLHYGARGISICPEWKDNYQAFKAWALANGYQHDLSLDRINVNGNYEPNNCRWATAEEQANNRRNNKLITINNETKTMKQWCNIYNISYSVVQNRIENLHWKPIKALTTPLQNNKKREGGKL